MFYVSTNKTEESWSRNAIRKAKPSDDTNELVDRIARLSISGMSYESVVDFYKLQLASWRRFYKQSDEVDVTESFTSDSLRCSRIKSLNIVFYVKEMEDGTLKTNAGFLTSDSEEEILEEIEEI